MRRDVLMPVVSPPAKGGKIARWHVSEGQSVEAGDILAEIVAGSATMEIEASNHGRVERILVPAGSGDVLVNTPIAVIHADLAKGDKGETAAPAPHKRDPSVLAEDGANSLADPDPGQTAPLSYREALRDALAEEMRRDPDVFLIGVDVAQNRGAQKVSQGLLDEFGPRRVVTASPLEDAFTGLAIGAALAGLKPVVEFTSWTHALEALHQIIGTAAEAYYLSGRTMALSLVFRGPNGWSPGLPGAQSRCFASLFAQVPGLKVLTPALASDAKGLLKAAIRDPGPVVLLEHDLLYATAGPVPVSDAWVLPMGKARIARPGEHVTLAAYGRAVLVALEAAEALAADGIGVEVVDLRSVRPLDLATVAASVTKTRRLLTVEDGWQAGSIGSEICAAIASSHFGKLDAPPTRLSGACVPMPYARDLEKLALPSAETVAAAVRAVAAQSR
jgi:pyruvate dehydrogenase E1 component beta subunit